MVMPMPISSATCWNDARGFPALVIAPASLR